MDTQLHPPKQAAAMLDMSVDRLLKLASAGDISYVLDGKRKKFANSDLSKYIDRLRQNTNNEAHKALKITSTNQTRSTKARHKSTEVVSFMDRRAQSKRA